MLNVNFINSGSDEALLKAMSKDEYREYDQEELEKAISRQGLVQKEVTVHTKNGTHTRMQWVKASKDEKPKTQGTKASNEAANEADKKATHLPPVTSKSILDMVLKEPVPLGKDGNLKFVVCKVDNQHFKDLPDGLVNQLKRSGKYGSYVGFIAPQSEPYSYDMLPIFGSTTEWVTKWCKDNPVDAAKDIIRDRGIGVVKRANAYVDAVNEAADNPSDTKNKVEPNGRDKNSEESNDADTSQPTSDTPHQITGNSFSALLKNAKDAGFEIDSSDSYDIEHSKRPPKEVTLYSGDKTYSATFNRYGDGGCEFISLKTVQGGTTNETSKVPNTNSTKVTDFLSSRGSDVQANKTALVQLLNSGESRESIIEAAKDSGITWKEHEHAGINWMRCSMALTGATTKGSKSGNTDTKRKK